MVLSGRKINRYALVGVSAGVLALGGLAPRSLAQDSPIQLDGSSTVFPISEAMAEEFMAENTEMEVVVGVSGTGGGFAKFCAGELDITGASRPIKPEEIEACAEAGIEYIEVPVASDAVTIVVNSENTWADDLTIEQLNMMWEPDAAGTITRWNQIDPSFPDEPINLFGPGTDSGTFDYFTETIMGGEGASRADYTASEDDNILVLGVTRDPNALGYFGFAYYVQNQDALKAVAINGVEPSVESVEDGTYTPLSRSIFMYVRQESLENRPEVQDFMEFVLENAPSIVPEVGYVPFSEERYTTLLSDLM